MAQQAEKAQPTSGELGDLVATFRGRPTVVPCLLIGIVAGLAVWLGFGFWQRPTAAHAIAGTIVGLTVAAGLFLLGFRRSRRLSVQVHASGLAYRAKATQETWAWDEVEEFFVLAERPGAPRTIVDAMFFWLATRYQVRYRICRPGHERTFDSLIRRQARLGAMVEDFVTQAQLPGALASLGSGEPVRFGKLQLGPDGLAYHSARHPRSLPLEALGHVSVTRYAVKVHQAGHRLPWLTAERSAVPNAAVLARLAEHIVAARDADDKDDADAGQAASR